MPLPHPRYAQIACLRRFAAALLLLSAQALLAPPAAAQVAIPPAIARIIEKAEAGKELTDAEQKALGDWTSSMAKAGEKAAPTAKAADAIAGQTGVCPKKVTITGAPTIAPTRDGYLALLKEISQFYGGRLGKARPQIDAALRSAKKDGDGADLGAALLVMGAGSASVYATAWSSARRPDDALAANNLGVALTGMNDFRRALGVLQYADALKPNAALVLVDIGWAYYNSGDLVRARPYFDKAARATPNLAAAQLGFGLIAECSGNHAAAIPYLRKALAGQYSAAGVAALKAARSAPQPKGTQPGGSSPIATEKGDARDVDLPDPPVSEMKGRTAAAEQALASIDGKVTGRIGELMTLKHTLSGIVAKQIARSMEAPDRSVVLPRDFAEELFLFEDAGASLFGENSDLAASLKQTGARFEAGSTATEREIPELMKNLATRGEYLKEFEPLYKQSVACGGNAACEKSVELKIDAQQRKVDTLDYRMCLRQKSLLDFQYTTQYKGWKAYWDGVKSASVDYYGVTSPILDRVYPPTLNELLNVERELHVLVPYQTAVKMGKNLPRLANEYASLQCIPPEPPSPADSGDAPTLAKREPPPCPFKKPLAISIAVVSVSLDCEKVRLEGGEGLLVSLQRDFTKHETTMGVGVGAEVGGGVASGSAKMMVELTTSGDVVKDVAFSSGVSTTVGLGATIQTDLGAQISLRGGPSISMETTSNVLSGDPAARM